MATAIGKSTCEEHPLLDKRFPREVAKLVIEFTGGIEGDASQLHEDAMENLRKIHFPLLGAMWRENVDRFQGSCGGFAKRFRPYILGNPVPDAQACLIWRMLCEVTKEDSRTRDLPLVAHANINFPSLNPNDFIELTRLVMQECGGAKGETELWFDEMSARR